MSASNSYLMQDNGLVFPARVRHDILLRRSKVLNLLAEKYLMIVQFPMIVRLKENHSSVEAMDCHL
jgi:hypothetical protein